jgi:hypothetical protein
MRQRLALVVPALALAAAGSVPLTGALSGSSAGASGASSTGGSAATAGGAATSRDRSATAKRETSADQDKGEHLDLTCWDRDRPMSQQQATATPGAAGATSATALTAASHAVQCDWHPATRSDFGGYKLVRTSETLGSTATFAAAGPKAASNPTLTQLFQSSTRSANVFLDTNVTFNTRYTYQLEVLDSHGNIAVRSEPQTVTDKAPPADEPETKVEQLGLDCSTHRATMQQMADRRATDVSRCAWRIADREDFASFRLTRQVQGSTQAPALLFMTTNPNQTSFTDTTAAPGVKYLYTLEELDHAGNVVGRSQAVAPHPETTQDAELWMDGRTTAAR